MFVLTMSFNTVFDNVKFGYFDLIWTMFFISSWFLCLLAHNFNQSFVAKVRQLKISNSRLSFSAGYYRAPIFYNSKNLNFIGALCFF